MSLGKSDFKCVNSLRNSFESPLGDLYTTPTLTFSFPLLTVTKSDSRFLVVLISLSFMVALKEQWIEDNSTQKS